LVLYIVMCHVWYLEDGGSRFLQNIFETIQHYIPENQNLGLLVPLTKCRRKNMDLKRVQYFSIK
jgi:hypothetical protein